MKYRRMISIVLIIMLSLTMFAGCFLFEEPDDGNGGNQGGGQPLPPVTGDADIENFFDIATKVVIDIDVPASQLALLQSDYQRYRDNGSKSPIYRMCSVTITVDKEQYTFDQVGIRMKGNTSRRDFYNDTDGITDLIHYKLSFQETFSSVEYYGIDALTLSADQLAQRKARTFLGMAKLDLKWNKNMDSTHIKEYMAYQLFREHGVLAPHVNKAQVNITTRNTTNSLGLYYVMETVDKDFIERYLPASQQGGDLYKVGWAGNNGGGGNGSLNISTLGSIGIEDEDANNGSGYFPAYDLKTNKKTSTHQKLNNLINQLDKDATTVNNNLSTLVDVNSFVYMQAVSYIVGNADDMRFNYNNYYIYFNGDDGKAIFIPYDYDRCFGINLDYNPTDDGMTSMQPYSRKVADGSSQSNPLLTKTILKGGNSNMIAKYRSALIDVADSNLLKVDTFNALYNSVAAMHGQHVIPTLGTVAHYGVAFSNATQPQLSGTSTNIDYATYITAKLKVLNDNIDNYNA